MRPVTLEDAPVLQGYFNDWEIIKNLSTVVPWPYPDNGTETFLRENALPRMERGEACVWAICLRDEGEAPIGLIELEFETDPERGNRGFWLARPYQRQGYMSEAVSAVNDFAFFECGLERLLVMNAYGNAESRRVKEKTGAVFLRMGELAHNSGETRSEVWEVTRENWMKIRRVL